MDLLEKKNRKVKQLSKKQQEILETEEEKDEGVLSMLDDADYENFLYGEVNILGEPFKIYVIPRRFDRGLAENPDLEGYTDYTVNKIVCEDLADSEGSDNQEDVDVVIRRIIRHEVLHAFLFRCGLDANSDWARNEELVDFFAIKFPDLSALYQVLEIDKK